MSRQDLRTGGPDVAPSWEAVRDAFEAQLAADPQAGAALAVFCEGRPVVDLWGGTAAPGQDGSPSRPWREDTVILAFSTAKGLTALALAALVDRGVIDLDSPVARWWPEFAAAGKEHVSVRQVASHQAGLPALAQRFTVADVRDPSRIVASLAAQAPEWTPGSAHGYHSLTFGWLLGELVRRATGKGVSAVLRDLVTGPLDADAGIGLADRAAHRCAVLQPPRAEQLGMASAHTLRLKHAGADPASLVYRTFANPMLGLDDWQHPTVIRADVPSATAVASARGLATVYQAALDHRVVQAAVLEACTRPAAEGMDLVLQTGTRFAAGFMLGCQFAPMGGPECFGSPGSGGSIGFADPVAGLAVAFTPGRMGVNNPDERLETLLDVVYEAAGTRRRSVPAVQHAPPARESVRTPERAADAVPFAGATWLAMFRERLRRRVEEAEHLLPDRACISVQEAIRNVPPDGRDVVWHYEIAHGREPVFEVRDQPGPAGVTLSCDYDLAAPLARCLTTDPEYAVLQTQAQASGRASVEGDVSLLVELLPFLAPLHDELALHTC